jgi:outer membrane protein OmpA-like peptidoglycan-associated protein
VLADPQVDRVFIDGHTDNTHTTTYNVELSRKRAGAVVDYLVSRGLSANQVTTRYHGERYPLTSNNTAQGRSENRRVTIRLERLPPRLSQR